MPQRMGLSRRALLLAGLSGIAGAVPEKGHTEAVTADRVLVRKWQRQLLLLRGDQTLHSFRCAIGRHPYGPKLREGDGRTPEGLYMISAFRAQSDFYRAVQISYPNTEDRDRAAALGLRPGGQIMIHGLDPALRARAADHWMFNWTDGCIAVTDPEMDIVWQSVEIGTPVEIRP